MPLQIADKDKDIVRTYSLTQELPNAISSSWTTVSPVAKIDEITTYQYATTLRSGSFASHEESVYIEQTISTDVFRAITSTITSYESTKTVTDVSYNTSDNAKFTSYNKTVTYTAFDKEETRVDENGANRDDFVRWIADYNTESMSFSNTTFPAASASTKYSNGSTLFTVSVSSDFNCVQMSKTGIQNRIRYYTNDSCNDSPVYTYVSDFPYSNNNITINKDGDNFYITRDGYNLVASIYSGLSFNPYGTHTSQTNFAGKISAGLAETTVDVPIAGPIPEMYRTSAAFFNLNNGEYPAFGIAYRQLCSSSIKASISSLVNDTYNAESTAFISYAAQSVTGYASVQMTKVDYMYTNYIYGNEKSTWEDYLYADPIMSNYSSALSDNQKYFYLHTSTRQEGYGHEDIFRNALPIEMSIWSGESISSSITRVTGLSQSSSEDTTAYEGLSSSITTTATSALISMNASSEIANTANVTFLTSVDSSYGYEGKSATKSTSGYTGATSINSTKNTAFTLSNTISATCNYMSVTFSGNTKYNTTTSTNATKVWSSSSSKTSTSTSLYAQNVTINSVSFTTFYMSISDRTVAGAGATVASTTSYDSFRSTGASNATTYNTSALSTSFAHTSYSSASASYSDNKIFVSLGTYNDGHPHFYLNFPGSFVRSSVTVVVGTSSVGLNPYWSTSASIGNWKAFYSLSTRVEISCTATNKPTYWGAIFGNGKRTFAYTATTTADSPYGTFTATEKVYGNMPSYVVPEEGTGFANQAASRLYVVKPNYALTSFKLTTYPANRSSVTSISSILYSTLISSGVPSSGTISTATTSSQTATTATATSTASTSISSTSSRSSSVSTTNMASSSRTYIAGFASSVTTSLTSSMYAAILATAINSFTSTSASSRIANPKYSIYYSTSITSANYTTSSLSSSTNTNGACTIPNLSSTTALTRADSYTTTSLYSIGNSWTTTATQYTTTSSNSSTKLSSTQTFTANGAYTLPENYTSITDIVSYPLVSSSSTLATPEWAFAGAGASNTQVTNSSAWYAASLAKTLESTTNITYYTETYPEQTSSTATFDTVTKSLTSSKFETFTVESSTTFPNAEYVTDKVSNTHYYATTTNVGTTSSLTSTYYHSYLPEVGSFEQTTYTLTEVSTHNTLA